MASGEGIPAGGAMSEPGKRGRGSLENSRKTWGRRQPMKASFMPLNGEQPAGWGRARTGSVRPHFCSMTLGNTLHLSELQLLICKRSLLIRGFVRLSLDAY